MMKRKLLATLLLACSLTATAQEKMTLGVKGLIDRQQTAINNNGNRAAANSERLRMVVKVADEGAAETFQSIREAGGEIEGALGQMAVVTLPLESVARVAQLEGIERMDLTHTGRPLTDVTVNETHVADIVGKPAGSVAQLTGKGVMVCIIDYGINFSHRAFLDANKKSRVKVVYLMDRKDGTAGEDGKKFTYTHPTAGEVTAAGYYYDTEKGINGLPDSDIADDTHGTHTAAIAVGSKSDKGFTGMAPEADIMLIPFNGSINFMKPEQLQTDIERALMFAVNYAKQHNLDMVINMSLGSHDGPHDGTGTIPDLLKEAAKTVIPVMSSGNEGDNHIHIYRKFTTTANVVKAYMPMQQEKISLFGIEDIACKVNSIVSIYSRQPAASGQSLKAKLSMYRNNVLKWESQWVEVKAGDTQKQTWMRTGNDKEASYTYDETLSKVSYANVAMWGGIEKGKFAIRLSGDGPLVKEDDGGCESFTITVQGSDGVEIDMWEESSGFPADEDDPSIVQGDNSMSASDWATTPYVISVGAYCANTKERQLLSDDETSAATLNDIAPFSSYGEYPNGVKVPTVCAPGVNVVSAVNPAAIDEEVKSKMKASMMWDGSPYNTMSGTSMAAPVVSGIIALWKQAKPHMTYDEVKKALQNGCTTDAFTAKAPLRWGFGKIDAKKGLEYILSSAGIEDVLRPTPDEQPAIYYDLQGRRVKNPSRGVYIVNGKKVLVK